MRTENPVTRTEDSQITSHNTGNRRSLALAGTAALLVGAGMVTAPAIAAPPAGSRAPKVTTIRFHSINKGGAQFANGGVQVDLDRALNGKVIGYDVLDFSGPGSVWVTVALSGGTLSGVLTISDTGNATGRVTSGTGRFRGATGTISAPTGDSPLVTIKYHR